MSSAPEATSGRMCQAIPNFFMKKGLQMPCDPLDWDGLLLRFFARIRRRSSGWQAPLTVNRPAWPRPPLASSRPAARRQFKRLDELAGPRSTACYVVEEGTAGFVNHSLSPTKERRRHLTPTHCHTHERRMRKPKEQFYSRVPGCHVQQCIPRMRRARRMSLGKIVTRLAWMASRFVSSNNPTR